MANFEYLAGAIASIAVPPVRVPESMALDAATRRTYESVINAKINESPQTWFMRMAEAYRRLAAIYMPHAVVIPEWSSGTLCVDLAFRIRGTYLKVFAPGSPYIQAFLANNIYELRAGEESRLITKIQRMFKEVAFGLLNPHVLYDALTVFARDNVPPMTPQDMVERILPYLRIMLLFHVNFEVRVSGEKKKQTASDRYISLRPLFWDPIEKYFKPPIVLEYIPYWLFRGQNMDDPEVFLEDIEE